MEYRYGSHTVFQIEYHSLCMGDEIPIQGADGIDGRASTGTGERNVRSVRDQDRQRGGEQGSRAHSGELSADHGAERDHEADQRANGKQAV